MSEFNGARILGQPQQVQIPCVVLLKAKPDGGAMNWLRALWRYIRGRSVTGALRDEAERAALVEEAMREIYLYRGLT